MEWNSHMVIFVVALYFLFAPRISKIKFHFDFLCRTNIIFTVWCVHYPIACTFRFRFLSGQWSLLFRFPCARASERMWKVRKNIWIYLNERIRKLIYNLNVLQMLVVWPYLSITSIFAHTNTTLRMRIQIVKWCGKICTSTECVCVCAVCPMHLMWTAPVTFGTRVCCVCASKFGGEPGVIVNVWMRTHCEQHNLLWFAIMHGKWVFRIQCFRPAADFFSPGNDHIPTLTRMDTNDSNDLSQ